MLESSKIWNFEEALLFRTLRGEIDPGESESDLDRNFQKINKYEKNEKSREINLESNHISAIG